jgi:hypothetical protein
VPEERVCAACGRHIWADDRYCPGCGIERPPIPSPSPGPYFAGAPARVEKGTTGRSGTRTRAVDNPIVVVRATMSGREAFMDSSVAESSSKTGRWAVGLVGGDWELGELAAHFAGSIRVDRCPGSI